MPRRRKALPANLTADEQWRSLRLAAGLFGVLFVVGLVLLCYGLRQPGSWHKAWRIDQPVTATLLRTQVQPEGARHRLYGDFRYTVHGRTYDRSAEILEAGSLAEVTREQAKYTSGQTVQGYYDADDPSWFSVTAETLRKAHCSSLAFFFGALLVFVSLLLTVMTWFWWWAQERAPAWVLDWAIHLMLWPGLVLTVLFFLYAPF